MPLWLQILSTILAAIGTVLGMVNIGNQWLEKREHIDITCVSWPYKKFRVRNPTSRPIEIKRIIFETCQHEKNKWIEVGNDTELTEESFVLQPYSSHDFSLSSPKSFSFELDKKKRIRVKTGSDKKYVKNIQG